MRVSHDIQGGVDGCTLNEQYIMAEDVAPTTPQYQTHPFRFSPCSIAKIREHLQG